MFIYGLTQYFFGDVIIFLLMLLFLKLGVENLFTFAKSTFCSNILLNMVLMLLFACCMLKKKIDLIEKKILFNVIGGYLIHGHFAKIKIG